MEKLMEKRASVEGNGGTQRIGRQGVTIPAPNFVTSSFVLDGTEPYVQHKFWKKRQIMEGQEAGSTTRSKKDRKKRDFEADFLAATYRGPKGEYGIPATAFRNAMISACRTVGYKMTHAKIGFFVEADGFDKQEGAPLVYFKKGKPTMHTAPARNANGSVDIRSRPMWAPGWRMEVRIRFDADMFTATDIANLLMRAGQQVGIGEGRPDSKESAGMGWGLFRIVN